MPELELMRLRKHAGLSGERYYDSNSNLFRGLGKDSITNPVSLSVTALLIFLVLVIYHPSKRFQTDKGEM